MYMLQLLFFSLNSEIMFFLCFWVWYSGIMYDNEFKTKEEQNLTEDLN